MLSRSQNLPLITIGIVVLNREWIIPEMLASLRSQRYPHEKLFILVVDGGSKDNTVKITEELLAKFDFKGHEVIVKYSNIPEARNICIQNMLGDYLLFWDSDVIMEPTAVSAILETLIKENASIASSQVTEVFVESVDEIREKWNDWESQTNHDKKTTVCNLIGGGFTLISKKVFNTISFDTDLTFYEDQDFSSRATRQGFKIVSTKKILGFDINSTTQPSSNIYGYDMPLKKSLRGIRKKAKIQAQNITCGFPSVCKAVTNFFSKNKRYLIYFGYPPSIILSILGLLTQNILLALILPLYFLINAILQSIKKGPIKGLNVTVRSIIVGIPSTYALLYYCLKLTLKKGKYRT